MIRKGKCTRRGGGAGGGSAALLLVAGLLLAACARVAPLAEQLPDARHPAPPALPGGLLVGAGDTLWALAGDTLWSFLPGEAPRPRGQAPPAAALVGAGEERLYLAATGRLHAFSPADDSVRAVSRATGSTAALDPHGRFVLLAGPRGEVMGLTPRALLSSWAWPRLGSRSAALVVGADGARVYHALHAAEPGPASRILTRDFQTGRVLGEVELRGWTLAAARGPGGELFLLQWRPEGSDLVALRPLGRRMQPLWRRELEPTGAPAAAQLVVAGERLWVVDREAGSALVIGRGEGGLLARVGFAPGGVAAAGRDGSVWVLAPGELLRYPAEGEP
jgi:hypothetical protein